MRLIEFEYGRELMPTDEKKGNCVKWNAIMKETQLCDYFEPKQKKCKAKCGNCKAFKKYNGVCRKDES